MRSVGMKIYVVLGLSILSLYGAGFASAQSFVLVNLDDNTMGFQEGFNDPTLRISDITGQMTTLGQDRLDCFSYALEVWARHLDVTVPIRVNAVFDPDPPEAPGDEFQAVIGFAGPRWFFHDFTGALVEDMQFVVSEANQHARVDLDPAPVPPPPEDPEDDPPEPDPDYNDLFAQFNADIDGPIILGSITWYYGIDGNPPPGKIDLLTVALHEIGHGLGFLSIMDDVTGAYLFSVPDIYTVNLMRDDAQLSLNYEDMTDLQRAEANESDAVFWKGPAVTSANGGVQPIYAPFPLQPGSSISHWDISSDPMDPDLLMEPFITLGHTDIDLTRQAFSDMLWPLLIPPDLLDPNNVYVDFAFMGVETGAQANPFNTLYEGVAVALPGANIFFASGSTNEKGVFAKPAIWQSTGGTVTIGVTP